MPALDSILKVQKAGREGMRRELEETQKVMRDFDGDIEEDVQMREESVELEEPVESKFGQFILI